MLKIDPKKNLAMFLACAVGLLVLPLLAQSVGNAWVRILDFALLYIMLALGLNIVVGLAGLLDLGFIAFYAVGAYMYALLASPHLMETFPALAQAFPNGLHAPIWLVIPLAAGLAALFGIILGAPTLKLRGDYLAIVTLGFGEIIRIFMLNLNAPVNLTNGPQGISSIDGITLFGWDISKTLHIGDYAISGVTQHYYLFLFLVVIIVIVCMRLQDSRIGRAWMAIREDEIAAKAMGINTRNMKLLAFAMGASFGGVAGAMFGAFQQFVSPESFSLMESIIVLAMVVLGGLGHVPGVILGAVLLAALPEALRYAGFIADWQREVFNHVYLEVEVLRQLVYALAMILVMLYRPKGLWPAPEHGEGLKDSAKPDAAPAAAATGGAR
jgi:branched-chain amino acid transport system permease protein